MDANPTSRERSPQSGPRGLSKGRSQPSRQNSISPDDGYNYADEGAAPEDEPTKETSNNQKEQATATISEGNMPDGTRQIQDYKPSIWQRKAGYRRAKIPDEEQLNGVVSRGQEEEPPLPEKSTKPIKRPWLKRKLSMFSPTKDLKRITKLRRVMLPWDKEEVASQEKIVLRAETCDESARIDTTDDDCVVWQHTQIGCLSIPSLQDLVSSAKVQGLQDSEIGLTRRLLERVRKKAERSFVDGKFLAPLALRYDLLDHSKYSSDKSSIFVAFPYFALDKMRQKKTLIKERPDHPPRTLLQSRYRLNDTSEEDNSQCVRMLKPNVLRQCVTAPKDVTSQLSHFANDQVFYVPQLWSLILGLDRMITVGTISDTGLQGRSIQIDKPKPPAKSNQCSLIRVHFIVQGAQECLTFPREQCASWFGLLNKHQQIRHLLSSKKQKAEPREYILEYQGQRIDERTWASVQRVAKGEVLDIWMKRKALKVAFKDVKSDQALNSTIPEESDHQPKEGSTDTSTFVAPIKLNRLEGVPVVLSFLEWRVIDEAGLADDCPLEKRLRRFLNAIYKTLPAAVERVAAVSSNDRSKAHQEDPLKVSTQPKIFIGGKDAQELASLQQANPSDGIRKLCSECEKLFKYFLPMKYNQQSQPIRFFWGAIHEIGSKGSPSYIDDLSKKLENLNSLAGYIHLGVHFERQKETSSQDIFEENAISESAILLSSMINALGAIFHFLAESIQELNVGKDQPPHGECGVKVNDFINEACQCLKTASNEMIKEALGGPDGQMVGPIITPEAILIKLIERLVCGVFGSGNIDIINILEQCVEDLALRVRDRYSRRLLQMLKAFEEEVTIVQTVMNQQTQVLQEFHFLLNPSNFNLASTARRLRYKFEKKAIDRILHTLEEQNKNCEELKGRAQSLAVQNVQLVETLQDDNSRAIFIFTFITVLFLPLSFISSFFGMNVKGIDDTTSTTTHFWALALPVTGGIVLLCAAVVIWGEKIWFFVASLPRACLRFFQRNAEQDIMS